MPVDVFISYRGADRVLARKLEQRLRSRWGSRVFRDETSLVAGRQWSEQLLAAMSQAKVTLALIGPGWHVRDKGEDWVRDELLGAINAGNPVLPVLIGNPDQLKDRLGDLPEAFNNQAVKVSSDLAGFDLHKIEQALRNLGAFGERLPGGLGREISDILPDRCAELISKCLDAKSIVVSGASGYGRRALLGRVASAVKEQGGLVTTSGINLGSRSRRTHAVVAAWIDGLCELLLELPPEERGGLGPTLVKTVLNYGPDLLARKVLRPSLLLPLGDDDSDQKILDAAQRPTDQWAPFPPERLVSQSMSVIEKFVLESNVPLTLIVDNIESIDGSSKSLVTRLLSSPIKNIRLVIATSAVNENADPESAGQSAARALNIKYIEESSLTKFESISLRDASTWGKPGAVIQRWLDRHNVCLGEGVSESFKDANPYFALSALWYLVDNGHLVEKPQQAADTGNQSCSPDGDVVTWVASRPDKPLVVPNRDLLLDHMIEEFIPIGFRSIIETGSLIGRRFLYSAAFAAAHPPESIDGQPPSTEAIKRWSAEADEQWDLLKQIDPAGSVIKCHLSADKERMINLAQTDLMTYLANQLDDTEKLRCHKQLAQYFGNPIANDSSETLDDKYRNAKTAAAHWARANETRHAADAERVAAGLADRALAYPEAQAHYKRAIRLFTQLLANKDRRSTLNLVDHEDLLILANCLYRLGQMTRLANERSAVKNSSTDPTKYFKHALKRLQELSKNLHNKRLVAPTSERPAVNTQRNLPEPNLIRHHIRLCETLSGWVKLELAEYHSKSDPNESRQLLFDALSHAESARGEADSRWLLAATSAQLAQKLVVDAMDAQQAGHTVRTHNLSIEAQFHIERVIGLAAVSPDEDRDLEEPRSLAWTVLGQLFQIIQLKPQLAGWAYNKMNDHKHEVSDLVDMMTDRRLGLYLLSKHRGDSDVQNKLAKDLLVRHKRWAIESGIAHEHSGAYISLALLELVEQSGQLPAELTIAQDNIKKAIDCALDANQKQNAFLLQGLLHAIDRSDKGGIAFDDATVVEAFRNAGIDGISCSPSNDELLFAGWRALLIKLLRWCPHVEEWVDLNSFLQKPFSNDQAVLARHKFISTLMAANDGELKNALERAQTYLGAATNEPIVPSNDVMIWRLLESRVPSECYQHACRTRDIAFQLLNEHHDLLCDADDKLELHRQDLAYAIALHEWYRSTDPSRLLILARESNMSIDGHEWASPKLLSGRLAIQILNLQYGAANEIGSHRLRQIESMVTNWTKGSKDAGPLEQIFHVAVQRQEPGPKQVDFRLRNCAQKYQPLSVAYCLSLEERAKLVRQAGLPLVQDLHLFDAEANSIDNDLNNEQTHLMDNTSEVRSNAEPVPGI